ncbi:UNVERIFIED_CONTAM: hypothetical protein Sradi_0741900 [Sesamum radiatum]|uniref:Uncharacterized protein n=1 Tax=Sesamum radiatum TaxID=300843 RepID=A0AAW2VQ63_SESRA
MMIFDIDEENYRVGSQGDELQIELSLVQPLEWMCHGSGLVRVLTLSVASSLEVEHRGRGDSLWGRGGTSA